MKISPCLEKRLMRFFLVLILFLGSLTFVHAKSTDNESDKSSLETIGDSAYNENSTGLKELSNEGGVCQTCATKAFMSDRKVPESPSQAPATNTSTSGQGTDKT